MASDEAPRSLHVVGRPVHRENGDLCGEYVFAGLHLSKAAYRKLGSTTAIRYAPAMRRWVIDRMGFRDSDTCVAYADDSVNAEHPGRPELVWHVWDNSAQAHVVDAEVTAVNAPAIVSLVGRAPGRENSSVCGEYEICAVHHGRPMYRQRNGDAVLRYYAPEGRWLSSAAGATGNICSAFANGVGAPHPGCIDLEWNFWESQNKAFVADPSTRTMVAPNTIHIIGRAANLENGGICDTYLLAGGYEGRPVYVQPGSQKVVRYSAKTDRWLIDCNGLKEPSLLSRLYQWILSGDSTAASERCSAYAAACGSEHPGYCALEWHVWETRAGRHTYDPLTRATIAPLVVRVSGRDQHRENYNINGEYFMAGTHSGRPAYMKTGTQLAIRYWCRRWVIDQEGLRNSDQCVAYADDLDETEHPAGAGPWHVFESSRACHLADPKVGVMVPADAPVALGTGNLAIHDTRALLKRSSSETLPHCTKRMRWSAQMGA